MILHKKDNIVVIGSLPTSKDSVPSDIKINHGCIEKSEIQFNAYVFESNRPIAFNKSTNKHFYFNVNTFIYGFRIAEFSIDIWKNQIKNNETQIQLKGKLHKKEFESIIQCIKKSTSVKNKYKNIL